MSKEIENIINSIKDCAIYRYMILYRKRIAFFVEDINMQLSKKKQKDMIVILRGETGMSRKEFAVYFGIPYSTVTDWELGKRQMPDYLLRLLAYRLKIEGLIKKDLEYDEI